MAARARRLGRRLGRRTLLQGAVAASAVTLAGCRSDEEPTTTARRVRYGADHDAQFLDLRHPSGRSRATVVLLHGGYWRPQYGLDQTVPLAQRLTSLGFTTANVEYRRTGAGGGWPHTFEDVATAIDRLADEDLRGAVVLLGHSAGGHLAVWAASRSEKTPGGRPRVVPSGVVSLSGVLDLSLAATRPDSQGPVTAFMGGSPVDLPARYAAGDPAHLAPAACRVWAAQADDDAVVPAEQAQSYVRRARMAGGEASVERLPGDHFTLIDPRAASFAKIRTLLVEAAAMRPTGAVPG